VFNSAISSSITVLQLRVGLGKLNNFFPLLLPSYKRLPVLSPYKAQSLKKLNKCKPVR
jgi:hypothetical protein